MDQEAHLVRIGSHERRRSVTRSWARDVGAVVALSMATMIVIWSVQSPAIAIAAVVSPDPTNPLGLLVQDTLGQTNDMTVRAEPGLPVALVFEDSGAATTTTAPQCAVVAAQVRCDSTALIGLNIALGDGNDTFHLDESVYALTTIAFRLIAGEGGDDVLVTGSGNDFLFGGPGTNRLEAGAGDDNLSGGGGVDTELGGPGRDRLAGSAGDDQLFGEDGVDQVNGEDGDDTIDGGGGDDVAWGGPGADTVRGGDGNDRLDNGSDAPDAAHGADTVDGGAGNDSLSGGPQVDPLSPDVFTGGGGDGDELSYSLRSSPLVISLDGSPNDGAQGEGDNVAADIERVVGGSGPDTLVGSAGPNVLDGADGDDTIDGRGGSDTLQGGVNSSGNDHVLGGDGPDVIRGDAGDDQLEGGPGDDDIFGEGGTDTLLGDEGQDVLAGGPGIDILHGGDGGDRLYGSDAIPVGADGGDKLNGDDGDDALSGGPGDDALAGGRGADAINGDDDRDTVSYEGRGARIEVTFDGKPNDGERGEHDNVAADVEDVLGGNRGDTLTGDARANTLNAGLGNDFVKGAAGADTLFGGKGADVLHSRDGASDDVFCGPGADLAIVDRHDHLRACDFADRGRRRPRFRQSAVIRPTGRTVLLRLRGADGFVPVPGPVEVPLGTTLDARRGTLRVVTTRGRRGGVQQGSIGGGRFSVLAPRGGSVTRLRLVGGDLAKCRSRGANPKKVRRKLRARVGERRPGAYEVVGEHSIGGAAGTTWVTEDRCDGTMTRVIEGTVRVRDLPRHRTVIVRAGHRYLARVP
jgi:Ca2+-binding RTX toxin-like protein